MVVVAEVDGLDRFRTLGEASTEQAVQYEIGKAIVEVGDQPIEVGGELRSSK
jgi:hypothetical protein